MGKCFVLAAACLSWSTMAFAQRDAIDLSTAVVWNSPPDVASWPVTTRLEHLTMRPASAANPGLEFHFPARATWPDYTPPGFEGPLVYTVWAGVRIGAVWHVSGFIRMWRDRVATGAPILTDNNFARNWAYDGRWGPMAGYQPVAGEAMIFFVTAGVARGITTVTSLRERSNVVMVNLPANDSGVFTFRTLTDLVIDQGGQGIWTLTDSASFAQIHQVDPQDLVTGDFDGNGADEIAIDFGEAHGLWIRWNGTSWSHLHPLSPAVMTAGDLDGNGRDELIVGFEGHGLWALVNGGGWTPLHPLTPTLAMTAEIDGGGADLVLSFPSFGVWVRFGSGAWFQVHASQSNAIVAANFDGLGRDDLAIGFGAQGTWIWMNAASWLQVQAPPASRMAAGHVDADARAELVLEFPGAGIWIVRNLSVWTPLHTVTGRHLVLADLDGNGRDEIVVDFGTQFGVWVWANDSSWVPVTGQSFERIVPAQLN